EPAPTETAVAAAPEPTETAPPAPPPAVAPAHHHAYVPPPRAPRLDCDPPFTIDAVGHKHYKPACLQ
ncbi:MAG TPA: hypothetical protein VIY73_15260, partial [Polyangiaceae bacterium]